MKCTKCDSILPEGSKFCQYCGQQIVSPSVKIEELEDPIIRALIKRSESLNADERKEIFEKLKESAERRNILYERQKPDEENYGFCIENPIITSTVFDSSSYLSRLRTADKEPLFWARTGAYYEVEVHGVIVNGVDCYTLYLYGEEYAVLYLCPYGHVAKKAPKGFVLEDEDNREFGGSIEKECEAKNLSQEQILLMHKHEHENEQLAQNVVPEKGTSGDSNTKSQLGISPKRFCKMCGGEIDENKKCSQCGKQYFKGLADSMVWILILSLFSLILLTINIVNELKINELASELQMYRENVVFVVEGYSSAFGKRPPIYHTDSNCRKLKEASNHEIRSKDEVLYSDSAWDSKPNKCVWCFTD